MDHLTPEEEAIVFVEWIFKNEFAFSYRFKEWYSIWSGNKISNNTKELYAIFKSEKENKLKD